MPDPRAAPKGASFKYIFCRYGHIAEMDISIYTDLTDAIRKEVEKDSNLTFSEFADYINNKIDIGTENFYLEAEVWRYKSGDRFLKCKVLWNNKYVGETNEEIQKATSKFQEYIKSLDNEKMCIIFFVWPDSFDTYLTARHICDQHKMPAGWRIGIADTDFSFNFPTKVDDDDEITVDVD